MLVVNFGLPPSVNVPVIFITGTLPVTSFILVIKRKWLLEIILSFITKILVPKIKISVLGTERFSEMNEIK